MRSCVSMRRRVLLLASIAAVMCFPAAAAADMVLVATDPSDGAITSQAPTEVRLTFDEPVNQIGASIQLISSNGTHFELGAPQQLGRVLIQAVKPGLPTGTTTAWWHAISVDGHVASGVFTFSVGSPSPTAETTETTRPAGAQVITATLRALRFAAIIIMIGLVALLLFVWEPLRRRDVTDSRVGAAPADARLRATTGWLGLGASLTLVLLCLAYLPIEAWSDRITISELLQLRKGRIDLAALLLAASAVPCLWVATKGATRAATIAAAGIVLLLAATPGLAGHASAQSPAWRSVAIDWVHVIAAGTWGGGLIVLAVVVPRMLRTMTVDEHAPLVRSIVHRFTRLALGGLIVLVVTGVLGAVLFAGSITAIADTSWGRLVIAKAIIVAIVVVAAIYARRAGDDFARIVKFEALLILIAIALTGALTGLAPQASTASPTAGGLHIEQKIDTRTARLDVFPGRSGQQNEVELIVTNAVGQPAVDVARADITLQSNDGSQQLLVTVTLVGASHWVGTVTIPTPGSWRVTARLRIGEFREATVTGTVTIIP